MAYFSHRVVSGIPLYSPGRQQEREDQNLAEQGACILFYRAVAWRKLDFCGVGAVSWCVFDAGDAFSGNDEKDGNISPYLCVAFGLYGLCYFSLGIHGTGSDDVWNHVHKDRMDACHNSGYGKGMRYAVFMYDSDGGCLFGALGGVDKQGEKAAPGIFDSDVLCGFCSASVSLYRESCGRHLQPVYLFQVLAGN